MLVDPGLGGTRDIFMINRLHPIVELVAKILHLRIFFQRVSNFTTEELEKRIIQEIHRLTINDNFWVNRSIRNIMVLVRLR